MEPNATVPTYADELRGISTENNCGPVDGVWYCSERGRSYKRATVPAECPGCGEPVFIGSSLPDPFPKILLARTPKVRASWAVSPCCGAAVYTKQSIVIKRRVRTDGTASPKEARETPSQDTGSLHCEKCGQRVELKA